MLLDLRSQLEIAPPVVQPIVTPEVFSGGFFFDFDRYSARRRKRQRELDEAEEAVESLAPVDAEIARFLQAQERRDETRAQVEQLYALAEKAKRQDMSARAYAALLAAQEKQTSGALEALEREMDRMHEEEEFALMLLLAD